VQQVERGSERDLLHLGGAFHRLAQAGAI